MLDFALTSDEWEGAFGFVSMRLHEGVVDGESVWFVRTDASDETFARREKLVFAPRIASLSRDGLSASWWWSRTAQRCSLGDVRAAERAGDLELEDAGAVTA